MKGVLVLLAALGCAPPPPIVTLSPVEAIVFHDVHPLFGGTRIFFRKGAGVWAQTIRRSGEEMIEARFHDEAALELPADLAVQLRTDAFASAKPSGRPLIVCGVPLAFEVRYSDGTPRTVRDHPEQPSPEFLPAARWGRDWIRRVPSMKRLHEGKWTPELYWTPPGF